MITLHLLRVGSPCNGSSLRIPLERSASKSLLRWLMVAQVGKNTKTSAVAQLLPVRLWPSRSLETPCLRTPRN